MAKIPTAKQQGGVEEDVNRLYLLMAGVIIVLFIGFAAAFIEVGGLVINSEAEKKATYQDLRDQVQNQGDKIDVLINSYNQTIRQQQEAVQKP